jgi:hypothetical protein
MIWTHLDKLGGPAASHKLGSSRAALTHPPPSQAPDDALPNGNSWPARGRLSERWKFLLAGKPRKEQGWAGPTCHLSKRRATLYALPCDCGSPPPPSWGVQIQIPPSWAWAPMGVQRFHEASPSVLRNQQSFGLTLGLYVTLYGSPESPIIFDV